MNDDAILQELRLLTAGIAELNAQIFELRVHTAAIGGAMAGGISVNSSGDVETPAKLVDGIAREIQRGGSSSARLRSALATSDRQRREGWVDA